MVPAIPLVALVAHLAAGTCAPQGGLANLEMTSRSVRLEVGDGAAVLVVRDSVPRDPRQAGSYSAELALAAGTLVGARVEADGVVIDGALEDDDVASERFAEFQQALEQGVAPEQVKRGRRRTALLADYSSGCCGHDGDRVHVQVATVCGADTMVVETSWLLESEPANGAWRFSLPRDLEHDQRLEVVGANVRKAFVDGDRALLITRGEDDAHVDVVTASQSSLRGRASIEHLVPLARLSPAPSKQQASEATGAADGERITPVDTLRVEVDVPRPLADPAANLRVVFVIDVSKSAAEGGIAKARAAMEGVLDALPGDARYAVVAFARRPWLVVDPWQAPRERFFPEVRPQNGSDVLGALTLARRVASDVSPEETPRVIVLSDLVQRRAASEAKWHAALERGDVLTHVVALPVRASAEDALAWTRVVPDEEPRALAVEGTGGIMVMLGGGDEDERALWPHLVAPTRIDEVALEVDGYDSNAQLASHGELPSMLHQGQGVRVQSVQAAGLRGPVILSGKVWAQPLALPLETTPMTRRLSLARTATGPVAAELDDALIRAAAKKIGAVSRVTSLVNVPGFRPPEPEGMGFGSSGCGCGCCGCGIGLGRRGSFITCGGGAPTVIEGELLALQAQLQMDAAACGVSGAAVRVELEDKELLDVVGLQGGACVVERVWRWDLLGIAEMEGLEVARVFERRIELEVRADPPIGEPGEGDLGDTGGEP